MDFDGKLKCGVSDDHTTMSPLRMNNVRTSALVLLSLSLSATQ